jgi:hypothetical protein
MFSTYLLFGEPDWVQMLFYALIFFGSLGAFAFVVRLIFIKVFRGGSDGLTTIDLGGERQADERRRRGE